MNYWQNRRVLTTGSGGFIGSHLAERLITSGASVRCLVHYHSDGTWGWLDSSALKDEMEVLRGDVRDPDSVRRAMAGREIVFHLAALNSVPDSKERPWSYHQTNTAGTLNMLGAARDAGIERFIQTSTSEVYGVQHYIPIDEDHPIETNSDYAASKAAADHHAQCAWRQHGTPVVIVRPFNCFGPRQSARAFIPNVISQALAGGPVKVGNLTPTRDFNYVSNTVDGFLLAGSAPAQDSPAELGALGRTFNIGSGRETSMVEVVDLIEDLMGTHIIPEVDPERVRPGGSEVERLVCDATLARTVLGWEPRVTLEEGLQRTIEWIAANQGRYRVHEYAV